MEETISCTMCGEPTTYLGTKLCNNCWELSSRISTFIEKNPEGARIWLNQQIVIAGHKISKEK